MELHISSWHEIGYNHGFLLLIRLFQLYTPGEATLASSASKELSFQHRNLGYKKPSSSLIDAYTSYHLQDGIL